MWARDRLGAESVEHRWSAQDYTTPDRIPYVGRLSPRSEHVFTATGFGKWGMSNGAAAALLIADAIAGRDNPWAATFDSNRLAIRQSIKGVLSENLDVAKRFVGDRLATRNPPLAASLRPGEGAIVDLEGETVAAFRDDDGTLHAVSATCTHLGCRVNFNAGERTWDCPCHGSRFDTAGRVIEGPATVDLEPRSG